MELQNFIGGAFVPSDSQKKIAKYSPFDGQLLAEVTASDAMDVIKAIQSAKKAAPAFKDLSRNERAQILQKMAQALENKAAEYAYQEALDQGLSQKFVLENSVQVAIQILRQTADSLKQELSPQVLVQPVGLVGIVTCWSLSLRLVTERLAPALAAGNVCVIKISEKSPITAHILGEVLQAAAVPAGVVNLLQGDAEVGKVIAGHPSIHAVAAAGKTSTMESIAKAGLSQFKKMQLSGSVKNASIILAGADFTNHMDEILRSFLIGQGQMCWNTSRLFILESMQKEFMESLKTALDKLEPLTDPSGSSAWTPLISAEAVEEVLKKTQSGVSEHGKVAWGAERTSSSGYFVKPVMMIDLPNCSVLQQDEIQGPLFLITPVKYQHEIAKWVNTSYLAHSAVIWGPPEKIDKVMGALECAQVWMNEWMNGEDLTVFGHKQSSFGNPDMSWAGSFYSDVKILTGTR
ncbi:aldehyde dehydrogenase family protein [Bdellovibrio bacteriovorus]|uniref:aldehyde dehydrogenase family protein n=1 Tax=Bdellovibrio bacteriovorus TaxID=959 RepID=UPI0021CFB75B|nr:aldehyde dehydrogenase family protein [Bdellovibrio bacteriovorus]UXR64884.1 aldehyde dehydrogenase family protein [Bdellovibrio bacteriovorus]